MKKSLLVSYFDGVTSISKGESYKNLLEYFFPELISAFVLYSALHLIDSMFVADLKSTSAYATLGVTKNLVHFIVKAAEGISVGATILCGVYNGAAEFRQVGRTLSDVFWTSIIVGLAISSMLYFGAYWIYYFYGVPEKMINLGIPFMRLKAVGVFLTFVYFAFLAFLRGVKNTKMPMVIYLIGAAIFIFFDYALIFGKFGFPAMGLQGSALATVIQYASMLLAGAAIVFLSPEYKKYFLTLVPKLSYENIKRLFILSWPVVMDKCIMAITYIWLGMMIAPMGKYVIAGGSIILDMERISFLPAIAFAQIITFLASNDFGARNYENIKINIKKCVFLSSLFVFLIILLFCIFPRQFISIFDRKGTFTDFAAYVFPIVSSLIFADILQIVLSGALRGIGQVRTVMWVRFTCCFLIFFPISYVISYMPMASNTLKFILIYGIFYICNGIMSLIYINKFRSDSWKKPEIG